MAILGFSGWANAGEIATSTLAFYDQSFDKRPLAEIDPDPFYDFSTNRPTARIEGGRLVGIDRPQNLFTYTQAGDGDEFVFFRGDEPHLCWDRYVEILLDLLTSLGTRLIITLGGTYDERLHTDPARVSVVAEDMVLTEGLLAAGGVLGEYEGAVSIHTALFQACREKGLPVVGLWGHAPVYVQTGNFPTVLKIVEMIGALGGPRPRLEPLREACREMDHQIENLVQRSPKLAAYIEQLKSDTHAESPETSFLPKGQAKVIPISRAKKEDEPSA